MERDPYDLDNLRVSDDVTRQIESANLKQRQKNKARGKSGRYFPNVPTDWYCKAFGVGRATDVAIVVWYYYRRDGMQEWTRIGSKRFAEFGITRPDTIRDNLKRLEQAGMISCQFHRGRAPRVKVLLPERTS